MKFRKKPVTIEAIQIPSVDDGIEPFIRWAEAEGLYGKHKIHRNGDVSVHTLEGVMRGAPGDWIIKGIQGEFYPCKADIFAETYEPVS